MSDIDSVITLNIADIVWREDLYPRFEPKPIIIQRYAQDFELLPPVEVNQRNELIDGYHRWTAQKKVVANGNETKERRLAAETIQAIVTHTDSDRHFARLAMRRNSQHGFHVSNDEKKGWLLKWYTGLNEEEKQELADDMGVSLRTVKRWTARKDKDLKARRRQKAFDLWLACHTYEEIAEQIGVSDETPRNYVEESQENDTWHKFGIFPVHANDPDWFPPLYDVWKVQNKSNVTSHPGNTEAQWVDNLLYMYTEPFDIVVDPFGGGGSTIDVCKKRLRRYWVSDRLPIVERRDIRQWDILDGPPSLHKRWGDVSLMYLDPPYWKQAEGRYSNDPQDLANMELGKFYDVLTSFIVACAEKMHSGSHIALIISPTQWKAPNCQVVDHIVDLIIYLQDAPMKYVRRIVCPYESQQYNAQTVEWAKENREVLVISREIIIWKVQ